MGNHRADRRGQDRRPSRTSKDSKYAGRRVAGRGSTSSEFEATIRVVGPPLVVPPTTRHELDTTASIPRVSAPGKRKAVKHAGSRGPLFRGLPSPPVLLGVATLAVAVGGTVTSTTDLAGHIESKVPAASALSGDSGVGAVSLSGRDSQVSRD